MNPTCEPIERQPSEPLEPPEPSELIACFDNPAASNTYLSKGSFGWSGAFNTHFFIDPTEHVIGLFMTQIVGLASRGEIRDDFETAVMQSIVGSGGAGTN
jgi:CubicO group peptidase (beta-lactamase class C family)